MLRSILVVIILSLLGCVTSAQQIDFSNDKIHISLTEASDTSVRDYAVYKGDMSLDDISSATPILVNITKDEQGLTLNPFVPFSYEAPYSLLFQGRIHPFTIDLPKDYKRLEVVNIYPSKYELPENLLKWHLSFNVPINTANIDRHIRIVDSEGHIVNRAFLKLENALLNNTKTILTLWVEPGRQKRGLGPNEKLGAVYEQGKNYTLIIDKNLKDQNGVSLLSDYKKNFTIVRAERKTVDPSSWKIINPSKEDDLIIHLGKSMDYISTINGLIVFKSDKQEISGTWTFDSEEQSIMFSPISHWTKGAYYIEIKPTIEDLAGNNTYRLFDQPINTSIQESDVPKLRHISFLVH